MINNQSQSLRAELQAAGAKPSEIDELLAIAQRLPKLIRRRQMTYEKSWIRRLVPFSLATGLGFVLAIMLISFSQTVLPGNFWFAAQQLSDNVAMDLHPSYRGTIMMKRAAQIKTLVASHASAAQVRTGLAAYRSVAAGYKFGSTNYDVLEFCRSNLVQAAAMAQGPIHNDITDTLQALPSA